MDALAALLHLGDLALTVPAALGIAAALAAARARRAALAWLLLFGAALGIVGADKIAFLGWGGGVPALDYRAASGHAAGVTALSPMLLALLLPRRRRAAVVAGLAVGLSMVTLLVAQGEHSVAEALAGWAIGALASACAVALHRGPACVLGKLPRGRPSPRGHVPGTQAGPLADAPRARWRCAAAGLGVFLAAALLLRSAPTGYWLVQTALLLSGQRPLFSLHS